MPVHCLVLSAGDLIQSPQMVPVYPSFFQMRKYDLIARDAQTNEAGTKKLRKLGLALI
jgi:hypothetical protein